MKNDFSYKPKSFTTRYASCTFFLLFPTTYDYGYQWSVGLIIAGMMKRAKFVQYGLPFVLANVALKERYREYKYRNDLHGRRAWVAWFTKFQVPALRQLGRPLPPSYR